MKNMFGALVAMAAMVAATPAMADKGGVPNGGNNGVQSSVTTQSYSDYRNRNLQIDIERSVSAASGSGFGGTIDVNGLNINGGSHASFAGFGLAGTFTSGGVGTALSFSGNIGEFRADAVGNAAVSGDVMNFGQSQFTDSFTMSFDGQRTTNFTETDVTSRSN